MPSLYLKAKHKMSYYQTLERYSTEDRRWIGEVIQAILDNETVLLHDPDTGVRVLLEPRPINRAGPAWRGIRRLLIDAGVSRKKCPVSPGWGA